MPRETATLELWDDYAAAGGRRKGELTAAAGVVKYAIVGDGGLTADVMRARWLELGGGLRDVLRVVWPEGTIDEVRVNRITDTADQRVLTLSALPVIDELATGGPILRVVGGQVATRLALEVALSSWITTVILPHEAAQRIGLTLGVLDRDPVIPAEFDAKPCASVLRTLFDAAGLELELVRAGETGWVLNGPTAIGESAATIIVEPGRTQLDLSATADDAALAQVVVPLGVEDPDTGDRATIANVRYDVSALPGSGWVTLVDPETGLSPILLDQQWVGAALRLPDLSTRAITNARASDGSVQVASTTGLTVGTRIGLVAADGSPLVEVFDTSAGAAPRVVPRTWSTLRGEANELVNARFADGLTGWTAANATTPPAFAEVARSELGITRTFQANGLRAAGTGTGTPFAVDGLPVGSRVLRGDVIDQAGSTHALSAAAIPSTAGALVLALASGLPASYTDNEAITLVRRELASLTLVGTTPIAGALFLLSGSADVLDRVASLPTTSRAIVGPGGETYAINQFARRSSTTALLNVAGWGGGTGITVTGQRVVSNLSVVSAQRLRVRFQLESLIAVGNSGVVDTYVNFALYGATLPGIPSDLTNSTGGIAISGVVVASGVELGENYVDVDVLGLPTSATFVGGSLGSIQPITDVTYVATPGSTTPRSIVLFSNATLADGSTFSLIHTRERRTLRLDGAHTVGATSVTFKAQAAIATRNWANTDTLYAERPPQTLTIRATAIDLVAQTMTIDLANSTAQDFADLWGATVFTLNGTFERDGDFYATLRFQIASIVGSTLSYTALETYLPAGSSAPMPATLAATSSTVTDAYAVTSAASWAATGLATVPITIPSGRTLYAGAKVWSNFHGTGPADSYMIVATTVVGPASSVSVRASDGYPSDWDGVTTAPLALWRAGTDSYLEVLGNRLIVAATATVNGSGQAALSLTAPNANAVPDNATLTLSRQQLLRPTDPTTGSVVWLLRAPGGVTSATPGLSSSTALIPVASGASKVVTALVTFSLPSGVYPVGEQPAVAIVDGGGNVLTTAPLATNAITVLSTPTVARIILQVTLTASTTLGVRIYGGVNDPTDPTLRVACLDAMLCVTQRDDVPFISSAWPNQLAQRGVDLLVALRTPVPEITLDFATLRRWSDAPATTAPAVLGQRVQVAALGVTRRILTIERAITNPQRIRVTVGAVSTDLTRRVAANAGA